MSARLHRRDLLGLALLAGVGAARAGDGAVEPPQPAPPLPLTDAAGRHSTLPALLRGAPTVAHLMFTGCGSVCPAQGFQFATLAARPRPAPVRWLSLSIDALGDDPARLAAWQARFGAHPAWLAAVPAPKDVDALAAFLRGASVKPGTHDTRVFLFDADARLVHRTGNDPSAAELEARVRRLAASPA